MKLYTSVSELFPPTLLLSGGVISDMCLKFLIWKVGMILVLPSLKFCEY